MLSRSLAVREAVTADLPSIFEIYHEGVTDVSGVSEPLPRMLDVDDDWFLRHTDKYRVWVAETDSEAVGWISVSPYDNNAFFHHTGEVSTYVRRSVRRSGVGSALRRHVAEQAPLLGFHALISRVWASNTAGIKLNEKFGWVEVARLKDVVWAGGSYYDLLYFESIVGLPQG